MTRRATSAHHTYHVPRLKELQRLYWAHTIKSLAAGMAAIFVPIYLYKLGYSLSSILIYFLLATLVWAATQAPALRFANRVGFNRCMGLSLLIEGFQILMLATIPQLHWPLWAISLVYGIQISTYWPQFRACFARSLLHQKVGPAVGLSSALLMLALGIAPAAGGAIATWFGITMLYTLAMLCFATAALPLLSGPETIKQEAISLKGISWRRIRRDLIANGGSEIDAVVAEDIWPLFIFLLVPSYVGVGVLSSVAVIASMSIALYVGRRRSTKQAAYLNNGTGVVSLTNAIRLITQSATQIAGINFINGLGEALLVTPFYSRYYQNAEHEPLVPYVYAMMMACVVADCLLYGSLLILSLFFSVKVVLSIGLLIAVPASYTIKLIRTA